MTKFIVADAGASAEEAAAVPSQTLSAKHQIARIFGFLENNKIHKT